MPKNIKREEIRVPATIDHLRDLRDFIARIGRKYKIPAKVINRFKLAVDEASTNIIRHAYKGEKGFITLRVLVKENSVTVALIDQGKYFDPNQVEDPDIMDHVAMGKRGGLGIFIMRRLVDEIDYRRTDEGNELRLTKVLEKPLERRAFLPQIARSLRTKVCIIASVSLVTLVIGGYIYRFFSEGNRIRTDLLSQGKEVSSILADNSVDGLMDDDILALSKEAKSIVEQYQDLAYKAIIVDSKDEIKGSSDTETFPIFTKFSLPPEREELDNRTIKYRLPTGEEVYNIKTPVISPEVGIEGAIGKVHLLIKKEMIDAKLRQRRMKDLQTALLILVLGHAGIILLVISITTPVRKLASWVHARRQGEAPEEIKIDASGEIGEIVEAFSEITNKLQQSQRDLADQERIKREMQIAREIQQTLLPTEFPQIEGYEIASYYEAAREVGGDYFDFVEVDRDTLGIVVADVSGKGIPGSMVMTLIRTALRAEARRETSAAEVLAKVNNAVVGDMKKGMFVTLFYIILDSRKRRINFASAGHNPMILYRAKTQKTYYLNPKGFPVGISLTDTELFRRSIESDTIQLTEGDIILIYTDGVTEAINPRGEMFGDERLLEVVRKYGHLRAQAFADKLKEELLSFTEGHPQSDDITFVVIKEKMTAEEVEFERAKRAFKEINKGKKLAEACQIAGIPVSTYRKKYKKAFEREGIEKFILEEEQVSVEAKHLSIEEQTKIFDIIKNHPEWGPARISEELNTEKYGFTQISESRIYEELKRRRLNTRELREAYISRRAKKVRMKPPGTPLLTLDGRIITGREVPLEPTPMETEEVAPEEEKPKEIERVEELPPFETESDYLLAKPLEDVLRKEPTEEFEETKTEEKPPLDLEFLRDKIVEEETPEQTLEEEISSSVVEDILGEETPPVGEEPAPIEEEQGDLSFIDLIGGADWEEEEAPPASEQPSTDEEYREAILEGLRYYKNKKYSEAIRVFKGIIEQYPDSKEAHYMLGNAYFRKNMPDEALEEYNRVKLLDPTYIDAYENSGVIYANRGDFQKAIGEWKRILEIDPSREDIKKNIEKALKMMKEVVFKK